MKTENENTPAATPAVCSQAPAPRLNLDELVLRRGGHKDGSGCYCVNEAVAAYAGEPHSAAPDCESSVIGVVVLGLNDMMDDDERQQLKRFIPLLAKSRGSFAVELKRTFIFVDTLVRESLPLVWEKVLEMKDEAATLRGLAEISGETAARVARDVVSPIYENHPTLRSLSALSALRSPQRPQKPALRNRHPGGRARAGRDGITAAVNHATK